MSVQLSPLAIPSIHKMLALNQS